MAENTAKKIKEDDLSVGVRVPSGIDVANLVSETVSKTIEGLLPLLKKEGGPRTVESVRQDSENIRSRIIKEMNRDFDHVINANKKFLERFANTPKSEMTTVRIPKVYAKYFGSALPVGLNGSVLYIPVDNMPYLVPKEMAAQIERAIAYEDEKISFMERTGNSDIAETTQETLRR